MRVHQRLRREEERRIHSHSVLLIIQLDGFTGRNRRGCLAPKIGRISHRLLSLASLLLILKFVISHTNILLPFLESVSPSSSSRSRNLGTKTKCRKKGKKKKVSKCHHRCKFINKRVPYFKLVVTPTGPLSIHRHRLQQKEADGDRNCSASRIL